MRTPLHTHGHTDKDLPKPLLPFVSYIHIYIYSSKKARSEGGADGKAPEPA